MSTAADQAGELRRSDPAGPGISRRRCGRGFRYFSPSAAPVRDRAALARIKALVIPPAWEQVWICPDADGHIQAVGTDAAGRRQYLYHEQWRQEQDQRKFDRMLEFGRALPRIRETVLARLDARGLHRDRVLALPADMHADDCGRAARVALRVLRAEGRRARRGSSPGLLQPQGESHEQIGQRSVARGNRSRIWRCA